MPKQIRPIRFAVYFRFTEFNLTPYPNQFYTSAVPSHRGALRNVNNAERDAMDAEGAKTKVPEADGEVVWS